jgi:2-hydroxy-6-oxonona-2,4-dienedioate hydrolase
VTSVLFKSEQGRESIAGWHDRFRARVPGALEPRTVETSFGNTHLLIGGPPDAPPVVLLHGALASSSHLLVELAALLTHFRVYAIDVIGQSVKSADTRLPVDTNDYGAWLEEVMEALSLPSARVVGVSWGGFVATRLAVHAPARIERLALLVPAGIVRGPAFRGFLRLGLPMTWYILRPTEDRLHAFAKSLLTNDDDEWRAYLGEAFLHYRLDMKVPALVRPEELAGFTAPTLVVAADQDVSFPGEALLARAAELFSGLVDTELLRDCQHSPPTTDEFRAFMGERLTRFFSG